MLHCLSVEHRGQLVVSSVETYVLGEYVYKHNPRKDIYILFLVVIE
jgi:hypothetical protein